MFMPETGVGFTPVKTVIIEYSAKYENSNIVE